MQRLVAQPDACPVVRVGDEKKANRERVVSCGDEVAQGRKAPSAFRHLLPAGLREMLRVEPHPREWLVVRRLGLRDLVLMVREHQVYAAAMDIEGVAQVALAHRRALDVPARPPAPEWRIPSSSTLVISSLRLLPQRKVADRLLVIF